MKRFLLNNDLKKATSLLNDDTKLVLVKGESVYLSSEESVKGLVEFINEGTNCSGFSAADTVVGKAAALLLKKMKVKSVHAKTISSSGLEVLENAGIDVSYDEEVPNILNKNRDGLCPNEQLVADIKDENTAYKKLKEKIEKSNKQIFGFGGF